MKKRVLSQYIRVRSRLNLVVLADPAHQKVSSPKHNHYSKHAHDCCLSLSRNVELCSAFNCNPSRRQNHCTSSTAFVLGRWQKLSPITHMAKVLGWGILVPHLLHGACPLCPKPVTPIHCGSQERRQCAAIAPTRAGTTRPMVFSQHNKPNDSTISVPRTI